MEKILEEYLLSHPDYWEYADELEEVIRLKELIATQEPAP